MIKVPRLLILRGVRAEDLTQKISATARVVDKTPKITYTALPTRFTGVNTWPKTSNRKCWSCDLIPCEVSAWLQDAYPKFVPMNPVKVAGEDHCDAHGHFCTWNCAARHIITEFPTEQQPDLLNLVCLFESKFSGVRKEKILPARPKTTRREYAGENGVTVQQWLAALIAMNSDYCLVQKSAKY